MNIKTEIYFHLVLITSMMRYLHASAFVCRIMCYTSWLKDRWNGRMCIHAAWGGLGLWAGSTSNGKQTKSCLRKNEITEMYKHISQWKH